MHILLIHQIFTKPSSGGGTRHYELSKYLVKLGHKVTVITSNQDYFSQSQTKKKEERCDGIHIKYAKTVSKTHSSILSRALAFLSFSFSSFLIALKTKDIDCIWSTSPPLFQAISSYIISKIKKKVFIFEIRDLWIDFAKQLNLIKNPFIYYLFKKIEYFLYKNADYLMVNSPGFIPHIKKVVPKKIIHLFPNGVICDDFNTTPKKIPDHLRLKKEDTDFIITYTGNIGTANDIETIIQAAEQLKTSPSIKFYFIGGGMNFNKFKKNCNLKGLTNITFLKSIPKTEMPIILQQTDVCLATLKNIPLFATVYPNKVFDYMAAKKPTILAIDGVIKEVIQKSNGGTTIPPEDVHAMKEAILAYHQNSNKGKEHGENASNYVKKHFNREDIAKSLSKFFDQIDTKKE